MNPKSKIQNPKLLPSAADHLPSPVTELSSLGRERNIPVHVHLELTYQCNLFCAHCYRAPRAEPELTTDEMKGLLDELADMGALFLMLTGGEPMARPDFFEIAAHARRRGFALRLLTNGTRITEASAEQLRELRFQEIGVSLYGTTAATHEAVTGVPGSLRDTVRGLELLKKSGIRFHVKCPIMTLNRGEARRVLAFAEELGVPCMMDVSLTPRDDGDRAPLAFRLEGGDLRQTVADPALYGGALGAALDGLPTLLTCDAGRDLIGVSPYGDVWPCLQLKEIAGNIRREQIRNIWYNSIIFKRLRALRDEDVEVCAVCEDKVYCVRCAGVARLEDGSLLAAQSRACEVAKVFKGVRREHGETR